ncbi:hypothetical protein GCM10027185_09800 [Spirosoma pulveris]
MTYEKYLDADAAVHTVGGAVFIKLVVTHWLRYEIAVKSAWFHLRLRASLVIIYNSRIRHIGNKKNESIYPNRLNGINIPATSNVINKDLGMISTL